MTRVLTLLVMTVLFAVAVQAAPARPGKRPVRQPDGTVITLCLHGDEFCHFTTTADGYTVLADSLGRYVYAIQKNGQLVATDRQAHDAELRAPSEQAWLDSVGRYLMPATSRLAPVPSSRLGVQRAPRQASAYDFSKFRGLMILVEYNDRKFSRSDYRDILDNMVNQKDYHGYLDHKGQWVSITGSVCDYFTENSGGRFVPKFDVCGPYQIAFSQYDAHGIDDAGKLIYAALQAADSDIDFRNYDGNGDGVVDLVYFVFAGFDASFVSNDERLLWSHRNIVNNPYTGRLVYLDRVALWDYACSTELDGLQSNPGDVSLQAIGTICHEFSHVLGLPDLYDADYEEQGLSHHPGNWSIMATGGYLNRGRTPAGYSLFERYTVGFMDAPPIISAEGAYELQPLATSGQGYRIDSAVRNEFFLLENRQRDAFRWDSYLPGDGLLVHRVDYTKPSVWDMEWGENTVNSNSEHNYYEVIRANGVQSVGDSVLDLFPNGGATTLTNDTQPAHLLSWSGEPTPWGLTDIRMNSGVVSFNVIDALQPSGVSTSSLVTSSSHSVFNLLGQRLLRPTRGLVIVDGRKLLVR